MTTFWDIALCNLAEVDRLFIALMMEAVYTSETSVYFKKTTQHYIPEGCGLHTYCCENLKYHITYMLY
jgi:hypothetical protein